MGLLSDLYRASRFGSSEADDPSTGMTGPVDPLGTSLSGSMAALMARSPTSGAGAWSPSIAASPPPARAPSLNDALIALARAWIGLDPPASAANGDPAQLQLAAARGAGSSPPRSPAVRSEPPANALPGDPFATPGLTNALDPATAPPLTTLQQRELDLENPYVKAFLTVLAQSEGATYNSVYGDQLTGKRDTFADYTRFPIKSVRSGRYQIEKSTYDEANAALGLKDYSPHTQDLLAAQLIAIRGAMPALLKGDLDAVLPLVAPEWASLPKGKGMANYWAPQPYTSYDQVRRVFDAYSHSLDSPF